MTRRLVRSWCAALAILSAPALAAAQGTSAPRPAPPAGAAPAAGAPAGGASTLPYREGTIWYLSFIRTKPGMGDDYLKGLGANWKRIMEEAKKQGLIISYKVLSATASNRDDWDLLLMVESKNWATLDGFAEKIRPIELQVSGSEAAERDIMTKRVEMREILGDKLAQEIFLK
jgi:hypothetical protein